MSSLAHWSRSSYLREVARPQILTHKHKSGETSFISDKTSTVWSPAAGGYPKFLATATNLQQKQQQEY